MRSLIHITVAAMLSSTSFAAEPTDLQSRQVALRELAQAEADLSALKANVVARRKALGIVDRNVLVTSRMILLDHAKLRAKGMQFPAGASAIATLIKQVTPETSATATIPTFRAAADHPVFQRLEAWLADADPAARVIAEPKIKTALGTPGFVHIGKEFPCLVPQPLGQTSVEYRRYGFQLDCRADLEDDGAIRLNVRPRNAELDPERSVTISGNEVPGLNVTECDTTVTMRPEQRCIVAGLLKSETRREKSAQFWQKGKDVVIETELVIVIDVELLPSTN